MEHEQQLKLLDELIAHIEAGKDADAGKIVVNNAASYIDENRAEREWDLMFRNHPQLIGLSGDIPKAGDYFRHDLLGMSVIALRDDHGKFRVFLNACRHRGAQVCEDSRGNRKRFSCPFHGWTYDTSGALRAVTENKNFGYIDQGNFNLIELPSEEFSGMLWFHPQREASLNVRSILGPLADELASWDLHTHVLAGENTVKCNFNWKLANDTFGENYHFKRLHKQTLNNIAIGDAHLFETFSRHSRLIFGSRGIEKLHDKPRDKWRLDGATTILYYLYPNIQLVVSGRQLTLFGIYPEGPTAKRSVTKVKHYFSPDALAMIESADKTVIDGDNVYRLDARDGNAIISPAAAMEVINSTLEHEDFRMAEMTQRSAESGQLKEFVFGRNEPALQHFHNTFHETLGLAPLSELT